MKSNCICIKGDVITRVIASLVVAFAVSAAYGQCPANNNDCCVPSPDGSPGCNDPECCDLTCAQDPFCCETAWDGLCSAFAEGNCEVCSGPPPGDGCCRVDDLPEGEPCDDTGTPDTVNGGCNSTPVVFGPADCGIAICGEAWAAGGTRDTDWHLVAHPGGILSSCLQSEFDGVNFIVDGIPTCTPVVAGQTGASNDCVNFALAEAVLPAGDYVVFVATSAFEGTPCADGDTEYRVSISCGASAECNGGPPPGVPNDLCEDRITLTNGTTDFNNNGAGGPDADPGCGAIGSDIWYNYFADFDGNVTIETCGSGFDTVLAAWDGCACPPTILLACNDDTCGLQSSITFPVVTGGCYKIQLGGFAGSQGSGIIVVTKDEGGCPGEGNCFEDNGSPGCEDADCCNAVCAADPFCCDTVWDGICADMAQELCGNAACTPDAGPCSVPNGTPGCEDPVCCKKICLADPFCCDTEWDGICADAAIQKCGFPPKNDLCTNRQKISDGTTDFCNTNAGGPDADPGCGAIGSDIWYNYTPEIDGAISVDTFGSEFDTVLAVWGDACCKEDVDGDGQVSVTDLVEVILNWGCMDAPGACSGDVNNDGVVGVEDLVNVILAWGACPECPGANLIACNDDTGGLQSQVVFDGVAGECYKIQVGGFGGSQGCGVINIVGGLPPICNKDAGDCFIPNGTPGCNDVDCCEAICAADPFCCDIEWDQICADAAATQCNDCAGASGDCCSDNGSPGCDDLDCCKIVCEIDPFCCETEWDGLCAGQANDLCIVCGSNCSACDGTETPEGEPCGDDNNGGCNSTPPAFTPAACGESFCGNAWADGGTRDTDWYLVSVGPEDTEIRGHLVSQFNGVCFIVDGIAACAPAVVGVTGASNDCVNNGDALACVPAGDYVVFAATADFDGTPCGSNDNEYSLTISCTPCEPPPSPCEDPNSGDCCIDGGNGTPGCDNQQCCELICAADPFCCDTAWDGICASAAQAEPACNCAPAPQGDVAPRKTPNLTPSANSTGS